MPGARQFAQITALPTPETTCSPPVLVPVCLSFGVHPRGSCSLHAALGGRLVPDYLIYLVDLSSCSRRGAHGGHTAGSLGETASGQPLPSAAAGSRRHLRSTSPLPQTSPAKRERPIVAPREMSLVVQSRVSNCSAGANPPTCECCNRAIVWSSHYHAQYTIVLPSCQGALAGLGSRQRSYLVLSF